MNLIILLVLIAFIVGCIVGLYIGFLLANKTDKNIKGRVAKMDDHELFMKRHGLKK